MHRAPLTIDSSGRPRILTLVRQQRIDRFGWTDFTWQATARMRYCRAYCTPDIRFSDLTVPITDLKPRHSPGCAYANEAWIRKAIAVLRIVNRG